MTVCVVWRIPCSPIYEECLKLRWGLRSIKKKNHILQCLASALMGQSQGVWICPPEPAVLGEELKWFEATHFSQCRAEDDPVHRGGQIKGIASKTACCQEEMGWGPGSHLLSAGSEDGWACSQGASTKTVQAWLLFLLK